jgi:hypothetical protein
VATSKVAIANGALQRLGVAKRLESLTQDHPNARSLNSAFEPTRDALLRKYPWSFAIARASIAADADGPEWGDWDRYTKPNDFLRLLRDNESGQSVDWKLEGDYILSADSSPLEIRYIARVEDPNKYDSTFIEALECALAAKCCKEITGSNDLRDRIVSDYDDAIAEARSNNAFEKDSEDAPEDEWLSARR